jgi:hypothetical protein
MLGDNTDVLELDAPYHSIYYKIHTETFDDGRRELRIVR